MLWHILHTVEPLMADKLAVIINVIMKLLFIYRCMVNSLLWQLFLV